MFPYHYRGQLLPNHSSLELDLEAELRDAPSVAGESVDENFQTTVPNAFDNLILHSSDKSTPSSNPIMTESTDSAIVTSMNASAMSISTSSTYDQQQFTGAMTGSTDSAIYSAPGSRSATASPLAFSKANQRYSASQRVKKDLPSLGVLSSLSSSSTAAYSLHAPLHGDSAHHSAHHGDSAHHYNQHSSGVLEPDKHGDFSLIDYCLDAYPPGHLNFSFDSGLSSVSRQNVNSAGNPSRCIDCQKQLHPLDSLKSEPAGRPLPKSECMPCSRCAGILNTLSAVNSLCNTLNMVPCNSIGRCNSVCEDVSEHSSASQRTVTHGFCSKGGCNSNRDSGCDFSTIS